MASRIVLEGETYAANPTFALVRRPEVPLDRDDKPLVLGKPVAPDDPRSPFRAGEAWTCPEDGVTYRVVPDLRLEPHDGWGAMRFWKARWRCTAQDVLYMVERGILDAAIEEGCAVKRYRCRDEQRALDEVARRFPRRKRVVLPTRPW